jgi:hypothetical protein
MAHHQARAAVTLQDVMLCRNGSHLSVDPAVSLPPTPQRVWIPPRNMRLRMVGLPTREGSGRPWLKAQTTHIAHHRGRPMYTRTAAYHPALLRILVFIRHQINLLD